MISLVPSCWLVVSFCVLFDFSLTFIFTFGFYCVVSDYALLNKKCLLEFFFKSLLQYSSFSLSLEHMNVGLFTFYLLSLITQCIYMMMY